MTPESVDWLPGSTMLLIGLVVGFMVVYQLRINARGKKQASTLEIRDLEGNRDALLEQLRELDDTASKRTEEQLASERAALEIDAARVLQRIEQLRKRRPDVAPRLPDASAAPTPPPASVAGQSTVRGFLWGVGGAACLGFLIYLVVQGTKERGPGETTTGNIQQSQGASQDDDQELKTLVTAVEEDPENLDARLNLAYAYLARRNLMKVFEQTQYVLQRSPGNARAQTYEALVRLAMNEPDVAESMLKDAIARQPDLIDAWIHLAIVYSTTGRDDEALSTLKDAMQKYPQHATVLQSVIAEMRAVSASQKAGATPAGESSGEMRSADGPSAGPQAAPPQLEGLVRGVIDIDAKGSVKAGSLLFVTARPAGVTSGPPVAVKRMVAGTFPMQFEISQADSMMGQPLPSRIRIEARIDSDGNALTRNASDPQAASDGVSLGTTDVRLTLR